jgi:predicted DNA-binding protein
MTQVNVRLSEREKQHLAKYCEHTERSQNDVIRELIRRLSISGVLNPLD